MRDRRELNENAFRKGTSGGAGLWGDKEVKPFERIKNGLFL